MPTERTTAERTRTSVLPGASEWLALSDDLLAGLVHAVNNRITALSVCAELAALGDDVMVRNGALQSEVARLHRAGALVGMLSGRGEEEALEIAPVLSDAIAIHAHHPFLRTIQCVVEVKGEMQPVRAPRWALVRLLLLLVHAAKATDPEVPQPEVVTVQLSGDDRTVLVRVTTRARTGAYATALGALCGGELVQEGNELTLALPSLTEVRRGERTESRVG